MYQYNNQYRTELGATGSAIAPDIRYFSEFKTLPVVKDGKLDFPDPEKFEQVRQRTGLVELPRLPEGMTCIDLAEESLESAISSSTYDYNDLDFIIVAHNTSQMGDKPTISEVMAENIQKKTGKKINYFDCITGCPAFVSASELADQLIKTGKYKIGAVISTENIPNVDDPYYPDTRCLFGVSAGTAIYEGVKNEYANPVPELKPEILGRQYYSSEKLPLEERATHVIYDALFMARVSPEDLDLILVRHSETDPPVIPAKSALTKAALNLKLKKNGQRTEAAAIDVLIPDINADSLETVAMSYLESGHYKAVVTVDVSESGANAVIYHSSLDKQSVKPNNAGILGSIQQTYDVHKSFKDPVWKLLMMDESAKWAGYKERRAVEPTNPIERKLYFWENAMDRYYEIKDAGGDLGELDGIVRQAGIENVETGEQFAEYVAGLPMSFDVRNKLIMKMVGNKLTHLAGSVVPGGVVSQEQQVNPGLKQEGIDLSNTNYIFHHAQLSMIQAWAKRVVRYINNTREEPVNLKEFFDTHVPHILPKIGNNSAPSVVTCLDHFLKGMIEGYEQGPADNRDILISAFGAGINVHNMALRLGDVYKKRTLDHLTA